MLKFSKIINVLIIFFLYWVSFEWTIMSFINNYYLIQIIRTLIDSIPLIFLLIYIFSCQAVIKKYSLWIVISFILIFIISLFSLIYEKNSITPLISYFGVSFRFVPFIFLTKISSEKTYSYFLKNVKIIFWIHVLLTLFQLVNRTLFMKLFLPNPSIFVGFTPTTFLENAINTTFIHTIDFSFFILSLSIIYLFNTKGVLKRVIIFIISLILIALSRSAASIIALVLIGFYLSSRRFLYSMMFILPFIIFIIFNQSVLKSFIGTQSIKTYIELSSKYNRVGYFTRLLPEFFSGNIKDIVLGMGADEKLVNKKLATYKDLPLMLTFGDNNLNYLKDVYWVSVIMIQGIFVFLLIMFVFISIYSYALKNLLYNDFILIKTFIVVILFLGFFNQILEIKCFSFCFWVMVGLTFNKLSGNKEEASIEI